MKNILLINGHPEPDSSKANKAIIDAFLAKHPEALLRTLAKTCGSDGFDVAAEQAALRKADVIIWQFPFFWYSVPALMKKWIDDVLAYGFAYGEGGTALRGKRLLLSFTTGAPAQDYLEGQAVGWPMDTLVAPLLQTAKYCGMTALAPVWSGSMLFMPGVPGHDDLSAIERAAKAHAARLCAEIESAA